MVILFGDGVGEREFPLEHAQAILDLPTLPKCWKLSDPNYQLKDGKIIEREGGKPPSDPEE